jgi:transposase
LVVQFPKTKSQEIFNIQLDNSPVHPGLNISIPESIILLFQPPHCPEVNPIERLWEEIKKWLRWELFENLDSLREAVQKIWGKLSQTIVSSLTSPNFLIEALSVAGI